MRNIVNKIAGWIKKLWRERIRKIAMLVVWTIFVVVMTFNVIKGKELLDEGVVIQIPAQAQTN